MPATLEDLAHHLERFFADRFPVDGADQPGSVLLVFDNLGRPLSPAEFTGVLAHQRAAELADQLPAPNALRRGWYLPQSGSRLSRWYASLVQGSTPAPGAGPEELASFEAAKAAAMAALEHNQQVVVSGTTGAVPAVGTHDTYYATAMSPVDWYAETAPGWNTYQVGAADQPDSAPADPPGEATPVPVPEFELMAVPEQLSPEVVEYVEYAVAAEPVRQIQPDPPYYPAELRIPVRDERVAVARSPMPAERLIRALPAESARSRLALGRYAKLTPAEDMVEVVAAPAPRFAAEAVVAAAKPVPVSSRGFAVRFEYTLVRLDRPWWDDVFLSRQDWQVPGHQPGQISDGSLIGAGKVCALTVGMVVIRNLTITANWSAADLAALANSTSLGPFCVAAADFDEGSATLTRTGLQAIAWLVQVPPVLPPLPPQPTR